MGLVISVLCVCIYCIERSFTWLFGGVFVILMMFIAFITAMYGITVGYHMAQKRMMAKLEHNIAHDELSRNYRGQKINVRRSGIDDDILPSVRDNDYKDNSSNPFQSFPMKSEYNEEEIEANSINSNMSKEKNTAPLTSTVIQTVAPSAMKKLLQKLHEVNRYAEELKTVAETTYENER